jgi:hypothetical protein
VDPRRLALLFVVALVLVGCGDGAAASFDPTGPCTQDGQAPGAYPELEALVPKRFFGDQAPDRVDSGRNCPGPNLGILADKGITELHFAGATWTFGAERAAVLAVFEAPGLTAEHVADFYDASAGDANRTELVASSDFEIAGRTGHRLDTKTGERLQTVAVWPSKDADRVNVVITNDLPDARIQDAIAAFGDS